MGDEDAEGVLANLAAAHIPTRAAQACRRAWPRSAVAEGLEVALMGEGIVQGQHWDAPGGIAEREGAAAAGSAGMVLRLCRVPWPTTTGR
jgi:hypothetical protein